MTPHVRAPSTDEKDDTDSTDAGPTLFIKGELSDYILPQHTAAMQAQFPNGQLKTINGTGHWVHSEKPEAVLQLIRSFLQTAE